MNENKQQQQQYVFIMTNNWFSIRYEEKKTKQNFEKQKLVIHLEGKTGNLNVENASAEKL